MFKELALQLNISEKDIVKIYGYYWAFIKEKVEGLPLKEALDESFFKTHRTSFNLPKLGKLYCSYEDYVNENKRKEYVKHKKDKASS